MRETKLTEKDLSVVREMDNTKVQAKKTKAVIKDYGQCHRVVMEWDLNKDAIRDTMFRLQIDDYEVILDAEELQRYLRWV